MERASRERGYRPMARVGLERSSVPARPQMILAVDIGGTKFSLAAFDGGRMVRRESRATDAAGGRAWMLAQIEEIVRVGAARSRSIAAASDSVVRWISPRSG